MRTCPKCDAPKAEELPSAFDCGSFKRKPHGKFGDFYQTEKCRVRELENLLRHVVACHESGQLNDKLCISKIKAALSN